MAENSADFRRIFLDAVPLMDVRAPVEFEKGAFPGAVNLPLMNDVERQKVGTCYTHHGEKAAIELGHSLVCGELKEQRIAAWAEFARAHPEGYLYCFRGGLRSRISQEWLSGEAGIDYPRIIGGYKAMRTFLMETTEEAVEQCGFLVLGGLTGVGKTEVVVQLEHAVDLEGHANHRGSSFGKRATPQPAPIDFENRLAIDLLRKRAAGHRRLVVEDEGHTIGICPLPLSLHRKMGQSPVVWLEEGLESRVGRILKDYVVDSTAEFIALHGPEAGIEAYATRLRRSLDAIVKRLGGERHGRLAEIMDVALEQQKRTGAVELHRDWIEALLREYYDPMYTYQKQKKAERIVFAGDRSAVLEYLQQQQNVA